VKILAYSTSDNTENCKNTSIYPLSISIDYSVYLITY